jgi:hypothetical protein
MRVHDDRDEFDAFPLPDGFEEALQCRRADPFRGAHRADRIGPTFDFEVV